MESLGLLFALAGVALGSVAFVLRPLGRPAARRSEAPTAPLAPGPGIDWAVDDAKEVALGALRDLERDHQAGNLAEGDYRALRTDLEIQAIRVLRVEDEEQRALDARLEADIAWLRVGASVAPRPAPAAGGCPSCGRQVGDRDRFCAECGAPLAVPPRDLPEGPVAHGPHGMSGGSTGPASHREAALPRAVPPALRVHPAGGHVRRWIAGGAALLLALVAGVVWVYVNAPSRVAQRPIGTLPARSVGGLAVDPSDANRLFAAGDGRVLGSEDGGRTWRPLGPAGGVAGVAVAAARPATLYAAGRGVFARSDDRGRTWEALADRLPVGDVRALALDPTDPSVVYAVAADRRLLRSADAGGSWAEVGTRLPTDATALAVVSTAPGSPPILFAATMEDSVFGSVDGGVSWENAGGFVNGALPTRRIRTLAHDPRSGDRYEGPSGQRFAGALYAGTDQGLFKTIDGGSSWVRLPLEADPVAVAIGPGGAVLVADGRARLFRSADRGLTWPGEPAP